MSDITDNAYTNSLKSNESIVDYEFQVLKYRVLRVESIPFVLYDKVKIDGEIFSLVPTYDMKNCFAFEYDGDKSFIGTVVEFI